MTSLKFYDVKKRSSFTTDNYRKVNKIIKGRNGKRKITMAVTKRNGRDVYRILKNEKV